MQQWLWEQVLTSQYDPLGFIIPFTTRAKVTIQQLWAQTRDKDDLDLPPDLQAAWINWESELKHLNAVSIPCCYSPALATADEQHNSLHMFCDASEQAYGAVVYLAVHTDSDTPKREGHSQETAIYASPGTLCCFSWSSASQPSERWDDSFHQSDSPMDRFQNCAGVASVRHLLIQGVRWNTCLQDTRINRP